MQGFLDHIRWLSLLLIPMALLLCGCQGAGNSDKPLFEQSSADDPTSQSKVAAMAEEKGNPFEQDQASLQRREVIVTQTSFDVLRARVPLGSFSESGKLWNHVDAEPITMQRALLLQKNGFRVGVGHEGAWPPIRALLEQIGQVETSRERQIISGGPLLVELDPRPRDQELFLFRPDGTLGGASFPESVNVLWIEHELSLEDPDSVHLRVMPHIRLPRKPPTLEMELRGEVRPEWYQPPRVLHELAFEMDIGPDEFLVIGPSPAIDNPHLAGALLLCEEVAGRKTESLYFITPRVVKADDGALP